MNDNDNILVVDRDDLIIRLCEAVDNMDDDSIAEFASTCIENSYFVAENDGFTVLSDNDGIKTRYSVEDALVACHQSIDSFNSMDMINASKELLRVDCEFNKSMDEFTLIIEEQLIERDSLGI